MPARRLSTPPTLDILLDGMAAVEPIPVAGVCSDSRRVGPGEVFFACAGVNHHGMAFAGQAIDAGCAAIVYDSSSLEAAPGAFAVPTIAVDGLAAQLGTIANRFFAWPSRDLAVTGVTGTNGKSTVAWLLAQARTLLGHPCAYNGTLGYGIDSLCNDDDMTSPDAMELHRRLARFRDAGASGAAIEVSSHALDQRRIDGVEFDAVVFTNLSRDHLDYHGTMQAYGDAKATLFAAYPANQRIICVDSPFGAELATRCGDAAVSVASRQDSAAHESAMVAVRSVETHSRGTRMSVQSSFGNADIELPLAGEFNVQNAAIVFAYLCAAGFEPLVAGDVLAAVSAPPGRLQRVAGDGGPAVYIDYAHTPDALEAALGALRGHLAGRLWVVFGCGGERDPGKRPLMGRIAETLADCAIVTNDNPRNEDPATIIDEIVAGVSDTARVTVIEDRGAAIDWAIGAADGADTVLVAGKGHEDYQLIGDRRLDFSDYAAASASLQSRQPGGRA